MHGMMKLSEELHEKIPVGVDNRIWFTRWCEPWDRYSENVWLLRNVAGKPEVSIYAYSWGAGWGAMQFAKHLGRANICVRVMVLSDPVYRHPFPLLRWTAFLPGKRIKVPPKVCEVYSYYQRVSSPQGHELVRTSHRTIIHPPIELQCTHDQMDDSPEFHGQCLKQARMTR